jgi:hypothetical protein
MRRDVDLLPLETSVAIIEVVAITGIRRGDKRSIPTMVCFFLQALLPPILPQATQLFTVPHQTWRTGYQPDTKRMVALG